jgi:hypothetical protein
MLFFSPGHDKIIFIGKFKKIKIKKFGALMKKEGDILLQKLFWRRIAS